MAKIKRTNSGFVMVTALLVLLVVSSIGAVVLNLSTGDFRFTQHEIWITEAEEVARSGPSYYLVHGLPPLVNGKPQKLYLFPQSDRILEIAKEGDILKFTGTLWNGNQIRARVSFQSPSWDLHSMEKVP